MPVTDCQSTDRMARRAAGGFSLLEMVVAVAIMAISLSVLYRAAGGATRSVGVDEKMVYAVELARSLVALNKLVPASGMRDEGETEGGFQWEVQAEPVVLQDPAPLEAGQLQYLSVTVRWPDGFKERQFVLNSIVAGERAE